MSTAPTPTDRRSGPPLWLVEGLDIVESRRRIVLGVAGLIIVVGLLLALLAPGVLPPTPLVGAAVALAALLIGVAAAVVADSSDLRVRGPRHVVAAGGELVAVLPVAEDAEAADDLAAVVLEARQPDRSMLLGLAASSLDIAATLRWTDALGVALARRGVSVLRVDLASGRSDTPGLAEVAAGEQRLTEVVEYEPGMLLARVGAGGDHREALTALTDLPAKLPRDLEVLLVALPIAASRGVVQAARGLDHVLVVAERGDTSRVDLIAGLDALRAADLQAQVVLLDDLTAGRIASGGNAAEVVPVRSRPATERGADTAEPSPDEPALEQPSTSVEEQPAAVLEEPPTSVEEHPTAVLEEPTTSVEQPTAVLEEPTTSVEQPTTVLDEPVAEPAPAAEPALEPEQASEPEARSMAPEEDAGSADVEEPDAAGPPPPPAAAMAAASARRADEDAASLGEPTERLTAADASPGALQAEPAVTAEPATTDEPAAMDEAVDPDDAAARVAAIVRSVMADHRRSEA